MVTRTEEERSDCDSSDDDVEDESENMDDGGVDEEVGDGEIGDSSGVRRMFRTAALVGLVLLLAMAGLVGWLGYLGYQDHRTSASRALFVQVARQGAVDLTTIDWNRADADVERILSAATGTFHDDFAQRSQPFVDVIKQTKSTTTGTVTAAGLESSSETEAQVMVAVSVQTTSAAVPQQGPRAWRMRIGVQKVGDDVKVSNVEFVP